ncbi:MAG: DUF4249 family protein [Bacteroidia bacterium]|nr:DUF4249 family protein [Bacteroidia bacterium]
MKLCFRFLFPFIVVLTFVSCSNEIDVLADYEENASIYALLDPNLSMQFVKINKVFVNPNSRASDVAKIADSLYFDTIRPEIIEIGTGRRIPLFKANILLKDSGMFANSPNYLYVTNEQIFANQKYRLELKLPNSGKLVTAETDIVSTPILRQPVSNLGLLKIFSALPTGNIPIELISPVNGKIFDAFLYFNYIEVDKLDTNIKVLKTIPWKILKSYRTLSNKGFEYVLQRIPSGAFYDNIKANISINLDVTRRFTTCEIILSSGNVILDTYIQSSTPSIGIVQKQTDYTNITNGIGIFGSRNTLYINEITISDVTKTFFVTDPELKKLGFVR